MIFVLYLNKNYKGDVMQLFMANAGDEKIVFKLNLSGDGKRRLEHLGFLSGEKIKVVSTVNGIFVVEVKGSRLAIDELTAAKILVC